MREVADGVLHLPVLGPYWVNTYLIGDTLVDTGMKSSGKKLVGQLAGRIKTVALTHAHPDHAAGASHVIEQTGAQYAVPAGDVAAAERGYADGRGGKAGSMLLARFPAASVDRVLNEGDEIAGFTVLNTPGHSPGHISFWRESDRVLICGDVFFNMSIVTTRTGLQSPPWLFTPDPDANRAAQRRLAELGPETVLFGHGPPLTGAAAALKAFVGS